VGTRCADHVTPLYPQKFALTSPTGGGRSVGVVRSRTKATEFFLITEYFFFRKSDEKIQVSLKCDNNEYFTCTTIYIFDHISLDFLRMKSVSDKCRENQNTRFMLSNFIFSNPAIYERMWKSTVDPDRPQMTVWRMRTAFRIPKPTNTHSEYVILIAFPQQRWLNESASMLRYTHIACLVRLSLGGTYSRKGLFCQRSEINTGD